MNGYIVDLYFRNSDLAVKIDKNAGYKDVINDQNYCNFIQTNFDGDIFLKIDKIYNHIKKCGLVQTCK